MLQELRAILDAEADTEAVTRAGFAAQEKMLAQMARENTEESLAKQLEKRHGEGTRARVGGRRKKRFT